MKKRKTWRRLDTAGLLFSSASNRRDPRVFRFYCELKEKVWPEALREALLRTVKIYPVFLTRMRDGLFWHYLEESELVPEVREEYKAPCMPIYIRDKKTLLFEVTYYNNRINFEVFHGLTDGTGATGFIRELVKQYLLVRYEKEGLPDLPLASEEVRTSDQEDDGFRKYYTTDVEKVKFDRQSAGSAYQIHRGPSSLRLRVSEGEASVSELLAKSRALGVSMTVFLTAALIVAIGKEMRTSPAKKPIRLMVPVNLRNFFESHSMLNFFAWIEPQYRFSSKEDSFSEVLLAVKEYFAAHLTEEEMKRMIHNYQSVERLYVVRFVPLIIKDLAISIGAGTTGKHLSAIFSNMSVVRMPAEYAAYIRTFGVFTSTQKMELCMCSFEDIVSFGFTSRYDTSAVQQNFYEVLRQQGIQVTKKEPMYPENDTPRLKSVRPFRLFSILCVCAALICACVNLFAAPGAMWSLVAALGIGSFWLTVFVGYYKRHNLLKNIMWLYVLLGAGSWLWDLAFGFAGWSLDYVFPSLSIVVLAVMLLISKLQSYRAREYMIYFLMASACGIAVPVIGMLAGAVRHIHLSIVSMSLAVLVVLALMIFRWKELKEEMVKKFHV